MGNWRPYWRYRVTHPSCWWRLVFGGFSRRRAWIRQGRPVLYPVVLWPGTLSRRPQGGWLIKGWGFDGRYMDGVLNLGHPEVSDGFVGHLARQFPDAVDDA